MDETYIGGRPRTSNKHGKDDDTLKTVSATKKTPVIGTVERGGQVTARMISQTVIASVAIEFLRSNINPDGSNTISLKCKCIDYEDQVKKFAWSGVRIFVSAQSRRARCPAYGERERHNSDIICTIIQAKWYKLMTDESNVYFQVRDFIAHEVIRHSDLFVRGDVHTNVIEGFRSLLKRAWYGQHHHYNREFLPLYVSEACWKYNNGNKKELFDRFVKGIFVK